MSVGYTASAPGKLLLTGEYAVLEGAPAISAAVNRRAVATVRPAAGLSSELSIANSAERFIFNSDEAGTVRWETNPGAQGSVLQAVLTLLAGEGLHERPAANIELCTRQMYASDAASAAQKIGVGSSAALTVALTAALQKYLGGEADFASCMRAHRLFQVGVGSGVDVATSWHGGVIMMQPDLSGQSDPQVTPLLWPDGLHIAPIWTGVAASTTQLLARLAEFRETAVASYTARMAELTQVTQAAAEQWDAGNVTTVLATISDCARALQELDDAGNIGIWSAPHQQLAELARAGNVVYKPSGAGGGDFGLAFAVDRQELNHFVAQAEQRVGEQTHGLTWSEQGLRIEEQPLN